MPTLDWLNRDAAFRIANQVPYRLLEPVSSHGDGSPTNLLVQGDNLDALKSLLPLYRGQVKCIFIDPPYNTKSAFEHYDDNLEHSAWLTMMLPRLQLLREYSDVRTSLELPSQSASSNASSTSPPTPKTSSSTASSAAAPPPPSRTRWAGAGSASRWAITR